MRFNFIFSKGTHYFYYDGVVRRLSSQGHEIEITRRTGSRLSQDKTERALEKLLQEVPGIDAGEPLFRRKHVQIIQSLRDIYSYAIYMRPEHPTPHVGSRWLSKRLTPRLYNLVHKPLARAVLSTGFTRKCLEIVEHYISPDERILESLRKRSPNVLVASPYIFSTDVEMEYVKTANRLGIPTIASVLSWDNLTSKDGFIVKPDWLFVWNRNLLDEAVQIHDFKNERVFISGAPVYDAWFDLSPSQSRAEFCQCAGLDPSRPVALYLCSSKSISSNEVELIRDIIDLLNGIPEERRPSLLVRPHPFKSIEPDEIETEWVKIYPRGGQRPDSDEARQIYYNSLYYSKMVIGINTTGFLETAVVDKPCLTLVTPMTSQGQEKRAHFKHLMDANFIEVATDFSELKTNIENILHDIDSKRENRRQFVKNFIRPHGISMPASQVMAGAICAIAAGRNPNEWKEFDRE